jgi:hypothetical protein
VARIIQPLVLPPGLNKLSTSLLEEGRYIDGDKVRSVGGVVETMGGSQKLTNEPQVLGICRGLLAWRSLNNLRNLALGTQRRLYAFFSDALSNITPLRATGTLGTDPFTTVSGSPIVVVAHTSHGLEPLAFVNYAGATDTGGLVMNGEFEVTELIDADSYRITHTSNASSSTSGGGSSVDYEYEINPGLGGSIPAYGFGVGAYGAGFFGVPRTASTVILRARTWYLDNAGEDVIASYRGGGIYLYDYSAAGRAAIVANAPTPNLGAFVASERHVVALGAGGDPMSAAWSDNDDITVWTPAAANQAGDISLRGGSELVGGRRLRAGMNILWSDTDCFRMVFLGSEPFYGFRNEGSGVGLIGPKAHGEMDGVAFWAGRYNFYTYDGFVREMPNQDEVRDFVFGTNDEAIDPDEPDKIYCFRNSRYREMWWLYQSLGSTTGEVDRYVLFNIDERVWYTGTAARTAWDEALIFSYPIAVGAEGYIYHQEYGDDDDGAAMRKYIKTASMDLQDGAKSLEIMGFLPDFDNVAGEITLTIFTKDFANDTERAEGPYSITSKSDVVDVRADGRQAAFQYESNVIGGRFRIGRPMVELEPGGDRRG